MTARLLLWLSLALPCGAFAQGAIDAFEFESVQDAQRYQSLIDELRCPKCLNTNLAGSDAPIAADLRALVYRLVRDGASDDEVRSYLQARYGDFVLYDPPVRADTALLWVLPGLLLVLGVVVIVVLARRRQTASVALDADARARLDVLLAEHDRR